MYTRIRKPITTLVLTAGAALFFTAAQAQTARFVSSTGDNANNCTRQAPCRTLQRGINKTPAGGELQILDSGVYGNSVTIHRSITISAVGVAATIGSITIDAPDATVVLRGLLLSGTSVANGTGILIDSAEAVHIVGCQIERFSGNDGFGVGVGAANVRVYIADTTVRENAQDGIAVSASATGSRLTIADSHFADNGQDGIRVLAGKTTITRVESSGNGGNGILNSSGPMNVASTTADNNLGHGFSVSSGSITVESSAATGNGGSGLRASFGGTARISNSVFTNNGTGLENISSTLLSRGNNTVSGNTNPNSGTITALSPI